MNAWPHQIRCAEAVASAMAQGAKRICVTCPTGGGKTFMQREQIIRAAEQGKRVSLYTNRRMLLEQTALSLEKAGINYGLRAAGYEPEFEQPIQLCSLQTVESREKRFAWKPHKADLVIVDEAHAQKEGTAQKIFDKHLADDAVLIGYTATPLGIGKLYDELIVAGTNSELNKIGALLPCWTYGPDEPDLSDIGPVKIGEDLTDKQNKKAIMRPGIFGRVIDCWRRLNPHQLPAILFAPGVAESIWFMEQFEKERIPAAHIDAKEIVINGTRFASDLDSRQELAKASESGRVKIVCNRFVMREGIDWPWLYHCIFASVFGSLTSYLQAGGRLLRAHPSIDRVILQDHGGNWHRHGSLNADRQWRLEDTNASKAKERLESFRGKEREAQPIVCPKCATVRGNGPKCPACGHESFRKSRIVVQSDGTLKEMAGDIYKPRVERMTPTTAALWKRAYYQAKNSKKGMTFSQAYGFFVRQHHYHPPRNLPLMPRDSVDWSRRVSEVPYSNLFR